MADFYLRGHGQYRENDGDVFRRDLLPGERIYFYGPPGYAMGGGLADALSLDEGDINRVGFVRRRNAPSGTSSIMGRSYGQDYYSFFRSWYGGGYNEISRNMIRNFRMYGVNGLFDGSPAGVFYDNNGVRTLLRVPRSLAYPNTDDNTLCNPFASGDFSVTIKQLISHLRWIVMANYNRNESMILHWCQCRSFHRKNRKYSHQRPYDGDSYKWGKRSNW
ncbi:hypothetical protein [Candidatus Sneabacter namystus]|uniref:Uncharacterized protein n=1 Tax=Candidatus Sneabacter namystus TaxID=2601646 RepID=A0A5C0UHX2_9RICK|nr:hypothetical protein [Candidatus Sneabacter namystus]QEK39339.1 hypothetical protein FZC37_00040 [Candidatus Sneabacter namystus]